MEQDDTIIEGASMNYSENVNISESLNVSVVENSYEIHLNGNFTKVNNKYFLLLLLLNIIL